MFSHSRKQIEKAGLQAVRVMFFHPRGRYPHGTYRSPTGFFHAEDDLVFMVTMPGEWRDLLDEPAYSEFDWAGPQEIRLMSSIVLCELIEGPLICLYPEIGLSQYVGVPADISVGTADAQEFKKWLLDGCVSSASLRPELGLSRVVAYRYDLCDPSKYALHKQPAMWEAIRADDVLLARAMAALIKSDMLSNYSEFGEEALMSMYIALEVSFKLVCARLKSEGIANPSANDAAVWVHDNFDKHFGLERPGTDERYFEEFYDGRVMTMHPSSRFGEFPYAPTMHDDTIHLRSQLRHLFSFLTLGVLDEDFLEEARTHLGTLGAPD